VYHSPLTKLRGLCDLCGEKNRSSLDEGRDFGKRSACWGMLGANSRSDRDDSHGTETSGDVQHRSCGFLVEGADPTASIAQCGGGNEEILHHRGGVLETIEISPPVAVSGGRTFGFGTHDEDDGGLDEETLIERGLSETLLDGTIRDHINEPGLPVARRRRLSHSFEEKL